MVVSENIILLKAPRQTPEDWDFLEKIISRIFVEEIYHPVLKILKLPKSTLKNAAPNALVDALQEGRVTFSRGVFSGTFNSEIVKVLRRLGAVYDRLTKSYHIKKFDLPPNVRAAITASDMAFAEKLAAIDDKLAQILPGEVAEKLKVEKLFDRKMFTMEKEFEANVKNITVAPQLSDAARANLAAEWQDNLRLSIKTFSGEQIIELRKKIQSAYFAGNRFESLYKFIEQSYGVSANKAKFLARNETTLLASKFRETRYRDSGILEYKWQAVKGTPKHPTREQHTWLSEISDRGLTEETATKGIFRFDDPPISTDAGRPERRNNPGQDYNCRCVARPVIRGKNLIR